MKEPGFLALVDARSLKWVTKKKPLCRKVSPRIRKLIGKLCFYCGCKMQLMDKRKKDYATLDHIIPKSQGGGKGQTVPACQLCNVKKGALSLEEYRRAMKVKRFVGEPKKEMSAHAKISYVKSGFRILGFCCLTIHLWLAAGVLIFAELIGIYEEFGL